MTTAFPEGAPIQVDKLDYTSHENILHLPPIERSAGLSWHRKEEGAQKDDEYDISPSIEFYRDGKLRGAAVAGLVDKDHGLIFASLLTQPTSADLVVYNADAHVAVGDGKGEQPLNPKTGKPWASGEMQAFCNDEDGCETGVITDCIMTLSCTPEGKIGFLQRTYHVNHSTGAIHWINATHAEDAPGHEMQGYISDRLKDGYADHSPFPLPEDLGSRVTAMVLAANLTALAVPFSGVYLYLEPDEMAIARATLETGITKGMEVMVPMLRQNYDIEVPEDLLDLNAGVAVMGDEQTLSFRAVDKDGLDKLTASGAARV